MKHLPICPAHGEPLTLGLPAMFGQFCPKCCAPFVLANGTPNPDCHLTVVYPGTAQARYVRIPCSYAEAQQREAGLRATPRSERLAPIAAE